MAIVMLASSGGCRFLRPRVQPPIPVPVFDTREEAFVGSALSGPTGSAVPAFTPDDVRVISVKWIVLESSALIEDLKPLDAQARLTTSPLAGGAVMPVAQMTRSIRYASAEGDDAMSLSAGLTNGAIGPSATVATQIGLVVPGSAVRFSCTFDVSPTSPAVILCLGPAPTGGALTVTVERLTIDGTPAASGAETSLVAPVEFESGKHFFFALPQQFGTMPWRVLVADVSVGKPTDVPQATAELTRRLAESVASVRAAEARQSSGSKPTLQSAIAALTQTESRRTPLLFLATSTDAPVAADFALGADDKLLKQLTDELLSFESKHPDEPTPVRVRWFLERTSIRIMTDQAAAGTLAPELSTVLAVHFGEVGRNPDTVAELVKVSNGVDDLNQRVVAENYVFLEDNSASSRVRAFDWLKTLGKAPAGYDPLGDARARRDAINKELGPD